MSAEIHTLNPDLVGDGYRLEPDKVLEGAQGQDFVGVLVIGLCACGDVSVYGSGSPGDSLILMERAKAVLIEPGVLRHG